MPRPLEFWFDYASSYSFLTALRIEEAARALGVVLDFRPFLLGPIFKAQGWSDSPFVLFPAKGRYMWRDIARRAEAHRLAFRVPSAFPRNSLLAARVGLVAFREGFGPELTRGLYRAEFQEDADIGQPEVIDRLVRMLGHDGPALRERAAAPETKDALRAQTAAAVARGIFGAPSFVVGDELFWGDDRLEMALAWAGRSVSPGLTVARASP